MKQPPRPPARGFTLVEIMAVIAIIIVLFAMSVGALQYVKNKQAREKARVQIQLLCKSIEDYKLDNGLYPGGTTSSTTSNTLYTELYLNRISGATINGVSNNTIYCGELNPAQKGQGWTKTSSGNVTIIDPWSNEYQYRTATTTSSSGQATQNFSWNPDFDIWSKGKDGQTNATIPIRLNDAKNNDDIGNF